MPDETEQPDRLPGFPHPREAKALIGHADAQRQFLEGLRAGRLHHAWLIGGPEGVGKATFAYRAAKMLLGLKPGQAPPHHELFQVDDAARASRLVSGMAHPDLMAVRREWNHKDKRWFSEIAVDSVREVLERLSATSGDGGWRVCIVDSGDELNASSANALLKAVEEPPPRCVFLILAHEPQRVMATIRSRCRKLAVSPLADSEVAQAVANADPDAARTEIDRAVQLAGGSARRALLRLDPETIALVDGARSLLGRLPQLEYRAVLGLADTLAGKANEQDFGVFMETVSDWMSAELAANDGLPPRRLARLAEVWDKMGRSAREIEVLNLDRRTLVLSIFTDLADAVTRMRTG